MLVVTGGVFDDAATGDGADVDSNYIITSKFKARASLGTIETEGEQSYYLQSKDYDQYIDGMTESFNAALAKE